MEDVASFDAFFRREYPALVALGVAVTGDRATAEDVAQEALARAHRRWATVAGYDRPGAWVRRVALNLLLSWRRRRAAERRALDRLAARPAGGATPPGDTERFWAAVRTLPARQRAVVALRFVDDRSVAEVAATLGIAEGTVKRHLHDARATLADRLREEDAT